MNLVDIHRRFIDIGLRFVFQPLFILPLIFGFKDLGGILRRRLKMRAVGIVLKHDVAGFCQNTVFIDRVRRKLIECCLPDTVRDRKHRVRSAVPVIEIADNGDINGVRCPDPEHRLSDPVLHLGMRTEEALCIEIFALVE